MAKNLSYFKILKKCQFSKLHIFFRLSNTYKFYACFPLDITCTLVPANELVSIWCTLDRVSILVAFFIYT